MDPVTVTHVCRCGHRWIGCADLPNTCLTHLIEDERTVMREIITDLEREMIDNMDPKNAPARKVWRQYRIP